MRFQGVPAFPGEENFSYSLTPVWEIRYNKAVQHFGNQWTGGYDDGSENFARLPGGNNADPDQRQVEGADHP